jgi:hypothetical protein
MALSRLKPADVPEFVELGLGQRVEDAAGGFRDLVISEDVDHDGPFVGGGSGRRGAGARAERWVLLVFPGPTPAGASPAPRN